MVAQAVARICGKWDLPFYIPLVSEGKIAKERRSYVHYVAAHQPLVSAKCLATEWLVSGLTPGMSIREYFGGVGVVSTILKGVLSPSTLIATDIDARCVEQLQGLLGADCAWQANAKGDILLNCATECTDMQVLDFPSFTAPRIYTTWKAPWAAIFAKNPTVVIFTDTACSYLSVHRGVYSEFFGRPITDKHSYTCAFSDFLFATYGYSIRRAAYRARNAAYYLCLKGDSELKEAEFPQRGLNDGFEFR